MNKILFIIAVICIAAATALCTNAKQIKKNNVKKVAGKTAVSKDKAAATITDTIASFRYELYKDGQSEVYFYNHTASVNSSTFYTRNMGSNTGWSYTVDAKPVKPLSQLAKELKLDGYPFTALDDEDTSRDRWIIEVKYTGGKTVSIVSYLSEATAANDAAVQQKCEKAFKDIKFKDANGKMMGEYTKTLYDVRGKRIKEIYYTNDGIVRGGRDFNEPARGVGNDYALPPKTY